MTRRDRDPFEDLFEQMNDMMRNMRDEMERMMEGFDPDEGGSNVWGYSVTKAPGEPPRVTRFGDEEVSGGEGGSQGRGRRREGDVYADVMEDDEEVRVVADLPGVEKDDIDLKVTDSTVRITASRGDRSYDDAVDLPATVDPDSAEATYNNGVLEVAFEKEEEDSREIDVE